MNETPLTKPISIESNALLIGEGLEEVLCFKALLKHLGIERVQVEQYNGKDGLALYLRTLKVRPRFTELKALGITRDADSDPAAAAASIQGIILAADLPSELTVRWFLLPSPGAEGALEDLCLAPLSGTAFERCIEEFFKCASRIASRSFETGAIRAKARVHAWLSLQDRPDLRLGHAAEKGLIDWTCPAFQEFNLFLRKLYQPAR